MNDVKGYSTTLRRYRTGLLLAVLLTAAPAALVLCKALASAHTMAWVLGMAVVQIGVHLYCFLDLRSKAREEQVLLGLTALIVLLMVGGTLMVFFDQMQRM
jgi:heme/copper-type cytochrome/quinol oxidase subunit 4